MRVHRSGNTFSTKMLLFGSVLLVTGLICNIEAVGPTVSNNEWTPVVNSQRVYLSPEVLAKYRDEELQGTQANERYDVVDNANSKVEYTDDVNVDEEASTEEVIIIQEEQQFEPKKVKPEVKPVVAKIELPVESKKVEEEQQPIIIYPEGTISQPSNNGYDDRPAPVYPSANQPQTNKYQPRPPLPERRPVPPPPQRRPRPPPPGSLRRPPPPPKYLPALSRKAYPPPPEEGARPPRPPPRGPPARRPPPRRPLPKAGILDKITSIGQTVKCKAVDVASDVRLQDENFVRQQLDCVLGEGPCDELGATIKRMAPDILRGICPPPCDECKKKQIQKVMSTIARKYPKEWSQMVQRHVGRR